MYGRKDTAANPAGKFFLGKAREVLCIFYSFAKEGLKNIDINDEWWHNKNRQRVKDRRLYQILCQNDISAEVFL